MTPPPSCGHYDLERVLGTGTFATVWLAHDDVLDRRVAVKVLADNWSRDADVRRRFLGEARVLLTAESMRITRGYELGETGDGRPYLVMTWADRGTLEDRISERGRRGETFAPEEAAAIVREIALAVADVHALGHLHRDVKPSNVLIRSADRGSIVGLADGERLLIGDFGLARGIDASAITLVAGSPGYVAPEQAGGLVQLDARADLYPLGRIMVELLTGDPGGRATTMSAAAAERVDSRAMLAEHRVALPSAMAELVERLVAADPDDRPASPQEVAGALEPFTDAGAVEAALARDDADRAAEPAGTGSSVDVVPHAVETDRSSSVGSRRRRAGVVAAGAVATLAVIGSIVVVAGRDDEGASNDSVGSSTPATPTTTAEVTVASAPRVTVALPPRASFDRRASDAGRSVATVALDVDAVVDYYTTSPPPPWRVLGEPVADGEAIVVTLSNGGRRARVAISPDATTAGEGISRIVITYGSS